MLIIIIVTLTTRVYKTIINYMVIVASQHFWQLVIIYAEKIHISYQTQQRLLEEHSSSLFFLSYCLL